MIGTSAQVYREANGRNKAPDRGPRDALRPYRRYGRDTLEEVFLDIARHRSHDGLAATAT
jgi:hypothetical protein